MQTTSNLHAHQEYQQKMGTEAEVRERPERTHDTKRRPKETDRWTEYCRNLYKSTDEYDHTVVSELGEITPSPTMDDNEMNSEILKSEVEQAIKRLKPN